MVGPHEGLVIKNAYKESYCFKQMHLLEISYLRGKKPKQPKQKKQKKNPNSLVESSRRWHFQRKEFTLFMCPLIFIFFFQSTSQFQPMVNKRQKSLWIFQKLSSQQQKDSGWCLYCGENSAEKGYSTQQVWQHMWAGQLQVCRGVARFPLAHENTCWGVRTIFGWRQ